MDGRLIRGLATSQGGTKQQNQQDEQQEGPKRPMTTLARGLVGVSRLNWLPNGAQGPPLRSLAGLQNATKTKGFLRFLKMSLFGSSKLLMALLGTSCGLLGPIRCQNGPQNGAQKWSKRGPKRAPKNDLKNDPKSADFGSHFGGSWGGPGGVQDAAPRAFLALLASLVSWSWLHRSLALCCCAC